MGQKGMCIMFLVRRAIWMLRFYTALMLMGVTIVAVDVNMQAEAAGQTLSAYDRQAYLQTLLRRLSGSSPAGRNLAAETPEQRITTPLDLAVLTYRGLAVARARMMGLDLATEEVALLPASVSPMPVSGLKADLVVPVVSESAATSEDSSKPCVRRNNVLSC